MRPIRIGLASINNSVGDFTANTDKVLDRARLMFEQGCSIGCFQEQTISGYPCEDFVQWTGFISQQWQELQRLAKASMAFGSMVLTVGLTVAHNGHLYNCVAVICQGEILGLVPKEKLPNYNVFYESRTFSYGFPGQKDICHDVPFGDLIFHFPFGIVAVEVCEDIWSPDGPMRRRAYSGAELIINASSSPWRWGVLETRREMIATRAGDNQCTVVYVNQFGGQDSLVFDGGSFISQNGRLLFEAKRWQESLETCLIDLDITAARRTSSTTWRTDAHNFLRANSPVKLIECPNGPLPLKADFQRQKEKQFSFIPCDLPRVSPQEEYFEELLAAMKTGLAGYFEKTGAFKRIGIALSGGKDSVLTLLIAWLYARECFASEPAAEASKKIRDFIRCFSMPTRFNSDLTRNISRLLCEELDVSFCEISIEEAFDREVAAAQQMLGDSGRLTDITIQNIQARIRGERMWNWSNSASALWLQTGNMSEKAVGYTTIGGDMMGGYSLIGNLPKTVVIELLAYLYRKLSGSFDLSSLKALLHTKASAELAEGQSDEDDLMPFVVLDACFALFVGEKLMPADLYLRLRQMFTDEELTQIFPRYQKGVLKAWVKRFIRLFANSIFKWVQAPQAVHLATLDLDRERALQLPVVFSRAWLLLDELDALPD
jgi:NAD+ synthase (glutamine-hydrolysing)